MKKKSKKKNKMADGRVGMSIVLDGDLYSLIKSQAEAESRSVSAQVRYILKCYIFKCYLEHGVTESFSPDGGCPITEI